MKIDFFEFLIYFIEYIHKQTHTSPKQTIGCFKNYSDIITADVHKAKSKKSNSVNKDKKSPKKQKQ